MALIQKEIVEVSVMPSVTGFENPSISPNPAGKLFMNTDLVGFGTRTCFPAKSQDFSPHKMSMNTNSGQTPDTNKQQVAHATHPPYVA